MVTTINVLLVSIGFVVLTEQLLSQYCLYMGV